MLHDRFVAKRYSSIRFSIIALAFVAGLVAIGGVAALRLTKDPAYWLSGGALAVAVILPIIANLRRDLSSSAPDYLDQVAKDLGKSVANQWSETVTRIKKPYPLQVPFSVVTTAALDPPEGGSETEGNNSSPGHADAPESPGVKEISIMDTWPSIRGKPRAEAVLLDGAFEDIAAVFTGSDLPRRLVILGEPGSGKSMIAQWLTVQLLAGQAEAEQVPVFLSLATWDPSHELEDWAAAQIALTYPFLGEVVQAAGNRERTLAYQLIIAKRVLMVLDGLDEMGTDNQPKALQKLSEFAMDDQCFVVTCRTADYTRIVDRAEIPLARTPVIALGPLEMDVVVQYLKDTRPPQDASARRWDGFDEYLMTEPDGPLAVAMTSSLVVWLVRTNYNRPHTTPDELFEKGSAEDIEEFLLDGLVDAVYAEPVTRKNRERYPALDAGERKVQRERLVYLADYLSKQTQKRDNKTKIQNKTDIEWWYLPRAVPKWFVGGTIGLICGCLLGAAGGVAAAIKFGHTIGLITGVALGIVAALHAGTTAVRWQDEVRAVGFSVKPTFQRVASCLAVAIGVAVSFGYAADRGGGLIAALVTAAVTGPLAAMAIKPTFGTLPAIATGFTASIAFGLAASLFGHRPGPLVSGGAAGLTLLVSAWVFTGIFQKASRTKAVSPESLLRGDRRGSLIVALTAGLAFAVVFGLALGALVGLLAFVGITVVAALTVSMWGAFTVTRVWLAMVHGMPLAIMEFLREADSRGVLRRAGGSFQFRHIKVQKQLSHHTARLASGSVSSSPAEAERERNAV
jgi:hypothetical protein